MYNAFNPGPMGGSWPGSINAFVPWVLNSVGQGGFAANNYQVGYDASQYGREVSPGVFTGIGGGLAGQAYARSLATQNQGQQQSNNYYQTEIANAQRDYGNLVNAYQRQLGLIDSSNQSIQSAYTGLLNQLIGGVAGTEGPARQAIYDDYLRNLGRQGQDLVSRGLTNTTVKDSVERGVLSDKWRRDNELSASMAQLVANYESQIGLAGLNAQREAQQQRNALDFQYTQLRQQADQYQRNLEQQYRLAMLGGGRGSGGGGGGGGGRQPLGPVSGIGDPAGRFGAFGALIPEGGYNVNNFGFGAGYGNFNSGGFGGGYGGYGNGIYDLASINNIDPYTGNGGYFSESYWQPTVGDVY